LDSAIIYSVEKTIHYIASNYGHKININHQDNNGNTRLMKAVKMGNIISAKALLKSGLPLDLSLKDFGGRSVLELSKYNLELTNALNEYVKTQQIVTSLQYYL